MMVYKFRSKLKGKCISSKFILVFSKSNAGNKPRTVAKSFTFTPEDVTKVKELFQWYDTKNGPKLISEIKRGDFVNIVCQVIGVYVAKTTDAVILKVWDGTKTNEVEGTHWGLQDEKLDQNLFTIAKNYYVVLSVYGHHAIPAGQLKPGQFIEVRDAHLFSPRSNPDECKLCVHAGNKEGRGIDVLNLDDERVVKLRERLGKIIADAHEFGNQTDELLDENNSIFLNCDISVFTPSQKSSKNSGDESAEKETNQEEPSTSSKANECENFLENIEALNRPLSSTNEVPRQSQSTVISVMDASVKQGQSTQEFGEGMQSYLQNLNPSQASRASVALEPDPISNKTPLELRTFLHEPVKSASQMSSNFFPFSNATQDEWWKCIPTVSETDGHSAVKPSSLAEVTQHSVPYKFRLFAVILSFKPDISSITKLIHLCCPKCHYITEDAKPSFEPFEIRDEVPYFLCPECCYKEGARENCPIMEYVFLISFSLHDGTGPSVEVFLWRENAVKFFKGITPEEAMRSKTVADSIFLMLWDICPNCRPFDSSVGSDSNKYSEYPTLDCCILSYTAACGAHYQMFDTKLV